VHGLAQLASEADVQLRVDLPPEPDMILGDPDQIQQVLTNLIENAIKYSGPGSRVAVQLGTLPHHKRLRGQGVEITVSDNGQGIDPIHLPRLTERFYRVDSHRSREMGGTGLGLAIVKHIINRHRGRLRIDSELGRGTTFTVLLPVS
jgi:two-component system phosphate regulon sensor histidine kinase PhoR